MEFTALRGMDDLLPAEIGRWQRLEATTRALLQRYGYREIRTPLLEPAQLFQRSVGTTSDIVQKEMYTLTDRGGRKIALRPEATASLVRAYVQHGFAKTDGVVKWYTLGPMFRAERPQAGRYRQFHQVGVEVIGTLSPFADAEIIALAVQCCHLLGLRTVTLRLNSLGSPDDKTRIMTRLRSALNRQNKALCAECRTRLSRNILRVLDCKNSRCQTLLHTVDLAACFKRSPEAESHYAQVRDCLTRLQIPFTEDPGLVRGLDYYTRTVFEIAHPGLGAKDAIGAGGRYDTLVKECGGPEVGAIGFAMGIERVLTALAHDHGQAPEPERHAGSPRSGVFVAPLDAQAQLRAVELVHELHRHDVAASMEYDDRSLKAQLRTADRQRFRYVAILGAQELADGTVTLRNLEDGSQERVATEAFCSRMTRTEHVIP